MSLRFVFYVNGAFTVFENTLNILGYVPIHQFPKLNEHVVHIRKHYGYAQLVGGLALAALGLLAEQLSGGTPVFRGLSLLQKMRCLGCQYAMHGVLNIMRSYVEQSGWGCLTAAYDFYGQKVFPPLAPAFDIQAHAFNLVKSQLDRLYFIHLFPPTILMKSATVNIL